jgi:hypothetical protein
MNIDTDYKIDDITIVRHLKSIDSQFLPKIKEVYERVKDILNGRVQHIFPNYTLHNTGHSLRIMEYMSRIVSDITKLNELELTLLIYTALLHDIGMALSEDDIALIKADSFPYCEVKFSAMKKITGGDEVLALQEYVRRIHASLSGKYILENLKDSLVIPKLTNLDFTKELALICASHTENYDWIKTNLRTNEVRGDFSFNSQYIAAILRLADILDIDGNRTPYNLYKLISPKGTSDIEWKQHFMISNNEKIIINEKTQQKKVVFHGKATNASVHRKILIYIGWVKNELIQATALVSSMQSQYSLVYDTSPEVNIQTEGYTFSDYKMTLEFKAISSLLMGEKIYGNRSLGLRELIQNSLDSCRIRQESEKLNFEFGQDTYQPKVKVIIDKAKKQVVIKDNGTGMSLDIIKKHFLNIGVSYYNSTDFLLKDFEYKPIGNFGIGFLSCFMLSDEVKVLTRHYKSKNKYLIELEKGNEWTSLTETEDVVFDGTEVVLVYKDFLEVFENKIQKVKEFLNQFFLTDGIDFELIDKSEMIIDKIVNPIILSLPLEKGFVKIDLRDYLSDIEGYVLLKNKSSFVKNFHEIGFPGRLYKYNDDEGFLEVKDDTLLNIDDYINGKEIKYLAIPIVESHLEVDFTSGMKFTGDDVEEVITKMSNELTWISVIVPKDYQTVLSEEVINRNDNLFDKLSFYELEEIGQCETCPTKSYVKTITMFEGKKNSLYLPYDKKDRDFDLYWWRKPEKRKELFMRSVLIKDFRFNIQITASIFEIHTIVVNINSRKFIPDISRNNVDSQAKDSINYMIGKAIHLGATNVLSLNSDEKSTLQNFIRTFYEYKSDLESQL